MYGTGVRDHTHHQPWRVNSFSQGRSRGPIILIISEALSDTDGSVTMLRLTQGHRPWQVEVLTSKSTVVLFVVRWPTLGPVLIKIQQSSTVGPSWTQPDWRWQPQTRLLVASNRLSRARQRQHLTLTYTNFRQHQNHIQKKNAAGKH